MRGALQAWLRSETPWHKSTWTWGGVIVILHLVGSAAMLMGHAETLLPLTPINLTVNAAIVMAFSTHDSSWRWAFTMFLGFAVEVIGVATGLLFGDYSYGTGLGPKVLDVPLLMGVLWWLLLLGTHHWCERGLHALGQDNRPVARAAMSATLMTAMDWVIEPVAIRAGWWTWHEGDIPWTNYATWWVAAFGLGLLWRDVEELKTNRLSGLLVCVFTLFLVLLNILPWKL